MEIDEVRHPYEAGWKNRRFDLYHLLRAMKIFTAEALMSAGRHDRSYRLYIIAGWRNAKIDTDPSPLAGNLLAGRVLGVSRL